MVDKCVYIHNSKIVVEINSDQVYIMFLGCWRVLILGVSTCSVPTKLGKPERVFRLTVSIGLVNQV